jgi:hypothetical protein
MEKTFVVAIPGTRVSGVDVSAEPRAWQRMRLHVLAIDFPTDDSTRVSAGRCRT